MSNTEMKKNFDEVKGYRIDFRTNTLFVNLKFDEASRKFGTAEYELVKAIRQDFPTIKTIVQKGRNPKTAHSRKRLTYANMAKHMEAYENSDELLTAFERVKMLSKPLASPYAYVVDWFELQFKDYKNVEATIKKNVITLIDFPDTANYKQKPEDEAEVA